MNAVSAVDTFFLVNLAESVLIIRDRIHRTYFLARTLQVDDRAIRTCLRALSALFAFSRIDVHTQLAGSDRVKPAGADARTAKAETAVIGYGKCRDRTFVARGVDDLNNVLRRIIDIRVLIHRQMNTLPNDRPLLIDTAAIIGLRSRRDLHDDLFTLLVPDFTFPRRPTDSPDYTMLQADYILIIIYHRDRLSALGAQLQVCYLFFDSQRKSEILAIVTIINTSL